MQNDSPVPLVGSDSSNPSPTGNRDTNQTTDSMSSLSSTEKAIFHSNDGERSSSSISIGSSSPIPSTSGQGKKNKSSRRMMTPSTETTTTTNERYATLDSTCQLESPTTTRNSSGQEEDEQSRKGNNFVITWSNLDYVIDSKWYKFSSSRKPILNGLSGNFKSGELSAVLGPSGAGKSSLIDCILGLKSKTQLSGSIRVRFDNPSVENQRRQKKPLRIALIPQEDHLLDSLTVAETFMFASRIKNAHLTCDEITGKPFDHQANVQRVIRQLNLVSCAKTRCGKLSGGQYKRVSIGQELLSRPELMILDEPTSGLDSVTCYQTVKALRDLIEQSPYPLAIVATIHQPDREVFSLFHKAYVLATGGRCIYEGPTHCIPETVQTGIELVEARRKQPFWKLTAAKQNNRDDLSQLSEQLDSQFCNPARAIVEVAANEYGFELISALNEMQKTSFVFDEQLQMQAILNNQSSTGQLSSLTNENSNQLYLDEMRAAIRNQLATQEQTEISHEPMLTGCAGKLGSSNLSNNLITGGANDNDHKNKMIIRDSWVMPQSTSFQSLISGGNTGSNGQLISSVSGPELYDKTEPNYRRFDQDDLLSLRRCNLNQARSMNVHFKHIYQHTKRSWLTIVRDPMLFTMMVALHILVPLMISYSFYGTYKADGCPAVGQFDILEEVYRQDGSNILLDINRELRAVYENLGYIFFQLYVIIFAGVCVTSLTYPLVMHVLVKEFRNGWYSLTSYFIGRTLADLPIPTMNVFMAMAISYHLTGQPASAYCWRFLAVALLTILATLVAQTQGLMFGALLMNLPASAVFVAPASTAPLVVVSGFLLRISSLPWILQQLSQLSFFTYLINGFVVARYGFDQCGVCDESLFTTEIPKVPDQAKIIMDLWAETYANEYGAPNGTDTRLVEKLVGNVATAKVFGYKIENCSQYKAFAMLDYNLEDYNLYVSFAALTAMLILFRWGTYLVLRWKIRSSI